MTLLLALLACAPKTPETTMPPSVLDTPPQVGEVKAFSPATPTVFELSNGVPVAWFDRSDLPLVHLQLVVRGGMATDPADRPGLVSMTDDMLVHGAGERDAAAWAAFSEQEAIEIDVGTGETTTTLSLDCHASKLETGLDLLADAVFRPRFDADELERNKQLTVADIELSLDEPATVARWVGNRLYFGEDHPLGHASVGSVESVGAMTAGDLKASWKARYGTARATFVVAGAVDQAVLEAALEARFGQWAAPTEELPALPAAKGVTGGPGLYLVDHPDATQTVLRVILPGVVAGSDQLMNTRLGVTLLGGVFTSRLNRLLREEKGYTYGVKAYVGAGVDYGVVTVSTAVNGEATADALTDLLNELARASKDISEAEVVKARGAHRTDLVEALESRSGTVSTYAGLAAQRRPMDALQAELDQAAAADIASVTAAMDKVSLEGAVVVAVGDLAKIGDTVKAAVPGNWTVVEP